MQSIATAILPNGTRARRAVLLMVAALFAGCAPGGAASGDGGLATPATLERRLAAAKGGATIRLAPGDYGAVVVPPRAWSPAIRIEAAGARFAGLTLTKVDGVTFNGGEIVGPGGRSYGILVRQSANVRIEGMRIGGAHRGIVLDRSSDVAVVGNRLEGLISDGINVALSRRVLVQRNVCRSFDHTPAVYAADGSRLRDGDHPDCIQAWSRPEAPPVADVQVLDNDIEGRMQGIFFGNGRRGGKDDGGYDRITIRGNRVTVAFPRGIALLDARDSVVTGNQVRTVPGAMLPNRPIPVKANMTVTGERNRACGNIVASVPRSPLNAACR